MKTLKVKELKTLCKEKRLQGYSKLKKNEIIDLIIRNEPKILCLKCDTEKDEPVYLENHYQTKCIKCKDKVDPFFVQYQWKDDLEKDMFRMLENDYTSGEQLILYGNKLNVKHKIVSLEYYSCSIRIEYYDEKDFEEINDLILYNCFEDCNITIETIMKNGKYIEIEGLTPDDEEENDDEEVSECPWCDYEILFSDSQICKCQDCDEIVSCKDCTLTDTCGEFRISSVSAYPFCEECYIINLSDLKVKELKVLCKEKGLKKYSKLKKQQLIELLKPKEE